MLGTAFWEKDSHTTVRAAPPQTFPLETCNVQASVRFLPIKRKTRLPKLFHTLGSLVPRHRSKFGKDDDNGHSYHRTTFVLRGRPLDNMTHTFCSAG